MLDQRRRRWADVVQMSYKCFVFAGRLLLGVDLQRLLASGGLMFDNVRPPLANSLVTLLCFISLFLRVQLF